MSALGENPAGTESINYGVGYAPQWYAVQELPCGHIFNHHPAIVSIIKFF